MGTRLDTAYSTLADSENHFGPLIKINLHESQDFDAHVLADRGSVSSITSTH
jgi:hypothetical protein